MPYPPTVEQLLEPNRFSELGPASGDPKMELALSRLSRDQLFPENSTVDADLAQCCLAGLWLYYDFLERSHEISQSISTPDGSYWHAIMHRREGDFDNSKYWLRRVGMHPVYERLGASAPQLAAESADQKGLAWLVEGTWDPDAWVDLCRTAQSDRPALIPVCQKIQQAEWRLLFDDCFRRAGAA